MILIYIFKYYTYQNMNYGKCDLNTHNLNDIAELTYITEPEISKMLFGKNKKKATKRITNLIKNESNSFSYNNIFLAYENGRVLGIIIGFSGREMDNKKERNAILERLEILGIIRILIFDKLLLSRMIKKAIAPDEFYLSIICVNDRYRRKGIGENLLKNVKIIAKKKKCKKIILNVSKYNDSAIKFYKKNGFRIYDEVNFRLFFQDMSTYMMELLM